MKQAVSDSHAVWADDSRTAVSGAAGETECWTRIELWIQAHYTVSSFRYKSWCRFEDRQVKASQEYLALRDHRHWAKPYKHRMLCLKRFKSIRTSTLEVVRSPIDREIVMRAWSSPLTMSREIQDTSAVIIKEVLNTIEEVPLIQTKETNTLWIRTVEIDSHMAQILAHESLVISTRPYCRRSPLSRRWSLISRSKSVSYFSYRLHRTIDIIEILSLSEQFQLTYGSNRTFLISHDLNN